MKEEIANAVKFTFAKFQIVLRPEDRIYLPSDKKASILHSWFGNILRKTFCVDKEKTCDKCVLQKKCAYFFLFETTLPKELRDKKELKAFHPPHPYLLEPPLTSKNEYTHDEEFSFNLILIGRSIEYLPEIVYVLNESEGKWIGEGKGKYRLEKIEDEDGKKIYESGRLSSEYVKRSFQEIVDNANLQGNYNRINISFLTPTRIKRNNKLITDLNFQLFIKRLLLRVSWLSQEYCDGKLKFNHSYFTSSSEIVKTTERDFRWDEWDISKQDEQRKLGGFRGKITFEGDLNEFLPFIKLGEYIHVGKNTSFGLGKYEIINEN